MRYILIILLAPVLISGQKSIYFRADSFSCYLMKPDASSERYSSRLESILQKEKGIKVKVQGLTPKKEDILLIEALLRDSLNKFSDRKKSEGIDERAVLYYTDIRFYGRQYLCFSENGGSLYFMLNLYCSVKDDNEYAQDHIINPLDGGRCYWNIYIDLKTGRILRVFPNSWA